MKKYNMEVGPCDDINFASVVPVESENGKWIKAECVNEKEVEPKIFRTYTVTKGLSVENRDGKILINIAIPNSSASTPAFRTYDWENGARMVVKLGTDQIVDLIKVLCPDIVDITIKKSFQQEQIEVSNVALDAIGGRGITI